MASAGAVAQREGAGNAWSFWPPLTSPAVPAVGVTGKLTMVSDARGNQVAYTATCCTHSQRSSRAGDRPGGPGLLCGHPGSCPDRQLRRALGRRSCHSVRHRLQLL